jgi:hypothetical protein
MGRKEVRKSVEGSLVLSGAFRQRFFVELGFNLFCVKRFARDLRRRLLPQREFTFLGR